MSVKAARASEFPVTEWETFEGAVYGYDADGHRVIEIDARTYDTAWSVGSPARGWAAITADRTISEYGDAPDLREAKKAALAALRAH